MKQRFKAGGQAYQLRNEYHEHIAVIEYLRVILPDILLTIAPNGIKLTMRQGKMFKAMGYVPGTFDILIFEPRGEYHGLHIEMKRETGGVVSPAQKLWRARAIARGYKAEACEGFYDAKIVIDNYFK